MANEFLTVSDGTYSLSETENKNQFYFYRNDGEVLTDIGRAPMDLYHAYIMSKMMNGEITDMVISNIRFETSDDRKTIRLTVDNNNEKHEQKNSTVKEKKPSFIKRLIYKIFG